MCAIFELIARVGETNRPSDEGETGTGKEVVAGAVASRCHWAPAADFVAVNVPPCRNPCWRANCSGHEKGAFTSASGKGKADFELAKEEPFSWMRSATACAVASQAFAGSRALASNAWRNRDHHIDVRIVRLRTVPCSSW